MRSLRTTEPAASLPEYQGEAASSCCGDRIGFTSEFRQSNKPQPWSTPFRTNPPNTLNQRNVSHKARGRVWGEGGIPFPRKAQQFGAKRDIKKREIGNRRGLFAKKLVSWEFQDRFCPLELSLTTPIDTNFDSVSQEHIIVLPLLGLRHLDFHLD